MVGVCVLSLAVCVGLAVWQWERFQSASGTLQNLGYVLQWPLFGLFPAWVFWRMRKLRAQSQQRDAEPPPRPVAPPPAASRPKPVAPPPSAQPDDELPAYNRYLAQPNRNDQQEKTR